MSEKDTQSEEEISLGIALLPIIFLIASLVISIVGFGLDPHIPIFTSAMFTALIGTKVLGMNYEDMEADMIDTISLAMQANLILMVIGMIIGTWIISGVVPTMIYYGLKIISPSIFLFTAAIMCSIVAIATGSAWTTAGTVGIALIGIGTSLGMPKPMIAGAIISGAYFGDKISPLSDTTNLAPAMAGTDLFTHIRHMFYTTVPSYGIALVLYLILGFRYSGSQIDTTLLEQMNGVLEETFNLHPALLLIPVITIALVVLKVPALPGLFIGAILGGVAAMIFQGVDLGTVLEAFHYGYVSNTGFEFVDELLSRGGMDSMLWTVSLILCAMCFGGMLETTGILHALTSRVLRFAQSTGTLIVAVVLSCIGINILSSDQYLSIVLSGRMFKDEFERRNLAPENLSRALEDSGTLTSPLIPWNTCGATMMAFLTLEPWTYVPYCFMNLFNPIISIIYGFTGFSMKPLDPEKPIGIPKDE